MGPLLKKAIAEESKTGIASWFDRLPQKKQNELAKVRKEYWENGAPCKMSAVWRICVAELGLKVKQATFSEWLKREKAE